MSLSLTLLAIQSDKENRLYMPKIHGHIVVIYEKTIKFFVARTYSNLRVSYTKVAYIYSSSFLVGGIALSQ